MGGGVVTFKPIEGVGRVVAFVGHARHGKDTAAQMLLRMVSGAERFAFSDALTVECRVHHGMAVRDPKVLQEVGMAFRASHPGVWLRCLYGAIEDRRPDIAIITGVRFADEAQMVCDMGGYLIRITRMENGARYVAQDRPAGHAAERDIDSLVVDAEIVVSGGLEDLEAQMTNLALHLSPEDV